MKKLLAVLLAVLMTFSTLAVSVMAAETVETTAAVETEEELVQPENFMQLFLATVFKAFEKVISTFVSLIESIIPGVDLDSMLSDGIDSLFGTTETTTAAA